MRRRQIETTGERSNEYSLKEAKILRIKEKHKTEQSLILYRTSVILDTVVKKKNYQGF